MLRQLPKLILSTMSNERKAKATLSSKLIGKMSAGSMALKRESEVKSDLFAEITNSKRTKVLTKEDGATSSNKKTSKTKGQKKEALADGNETIIAEAEAHIDKEPQDNNAESMRLAMALKTKAVAKNARAKRNVKSAPEIESKANKNTLELKGTSDQACSLTVEVKPPMPETNATKTKVSARKGKAKIESKYPKDLELKAPIEIKNEMECIETNTSSQDSKPLKTKASKVKKAKAKEVMASIKNEIKEEVVDKWEPNNWRELLDNIRIMRSNDKAPVDTMGCHKCADENADEKTQRFHKLVALMLSSQTKDETTYHAMLRLKEQSLTPESICAIKPNVLENILHPVSFYKNKAKYLQQTARILIDKYDSDIPNNIKELVALPGVGPKMAHICMATAWQETTGIGVDVHVHRICNRLEWVPKPTKEPEQTRAALEAWLPRDLWKEVNHLLVGFGQTTCTPLRPKCAECLNCSICPAATRTNKNVPNKNLQDICDAAKFKKAKMHL